MGDAALGVENTRDARSGTDESRDVIYLSNINTATHGRIQQLYCKKISVYPRIFNEARAHIVKFVWNNYVA